MHAHTHTHTHHTHTHHTHTPHTHTTLTHHTHHTHTHTHHTPHTPHTQFEVMASTQSDFAKTDSYQKVVKFTNDGVYVVTGGVDGVVRVWKVSVRTEHKLVSNPGPAS